MTDTSDVLDIHNTSQVITEISKSHILEMIKENNVSKWERYVIICFRLYQSIFEENMVDIMYSLMLEGNNLAKKTWKFIKIVNTDFISNVHRMLFERIYLLNQAYVLSNNMWVLNVRINEKSLLRLVSNNAACYPMIMIPDRPEITIYFLTHIVKNHNLYDIQLIWDNIYKCLNHQIKKIKSFDVMMICMEHNLPRISQNIVSVLSIIDDESSLRIVTEMLERNIEIVPNFIFCVITNRKVKILELFWQYGVDVKQIINSIPCQDTQRTTDMGQILDKLGVTLTDYFRAIYGNLEYKNQKKFSFVMS